MLPQIPSVTKVTDRSVSAEVTILTNVTDNEAVYKCEAANSATEAIPLFETVTLSVYCKFSLNYLYNSVFYQSWTAACSNIFDVLLLNETGF